jgi:hypothetical protein
MQINRSNYEIWFIDWLDGNLNEVQIEELRNFLITNPELKSEFDDLTAARLIPAQNSFSKKEDLKKKLTDLTDSQIEYLSIAYLEKDIAPDQETELLEIIGIDHGKRSSFELIQKMKLVPPRIFYKRKRHLLKRTLATKLISLSLIGLSAAAIITFVILNFFSVPRSFSVESEKTAQSDKPDTAIKYMTTAKIAEKSVVANKKTSPKKQIKSLPAFPTKLSVVNSVQVSDNLDSLLRTPADPSTLVRKVPITATIKLETEVIRKSLIAYNSQSKMPQDEDDGRSKLSRFIARTFREKFLKEKTATDTPLKAYEIAEAGVSGLNTLFGWDMSLDKKNDEKGELKSVYFSSKIIKFNAPIKKTETVR